jgi:hypothetical protein
MQDKGEEGRDGWQERAGQREGKRKKGKEKGGAGKLAPKHKNLTLPMWWTIYRDVLNSYPMVIKA